MTLTAVDQFARADPAGDERYYRDLIPLTAPGPGEQYAFEVDLDSCTGCKACVTACHSLNGLDEDESWRSVGLIQSPKSVGYQQTVTTACHHCVDPACLSGCPVDAYEKDPVTGIVSHLDDQCIGCSYCTLTCPYEVPRFNKERGIVRKCDMCAGRLAAGEAPACVQACPNDAIKISIVSTRSAVATGSLVPGAPSSAITRPTTTYRTSRPIPDDVIAADHFALRPQHAHPPLAVMLVLTQLAVGALAVEVALHLVGRPGRGAVAVAAATGVLALLASTLHLGRPLYAFRAVLGLGHSWLSREIVAFGAFAALAPAYAITRWPAVGLAAVGAGVAGVGCSVALYAFTKRTYWSAGRTALTFVLSAAATGLVTTAVARPSLGGAAAALAGVKLLRELAFFRHLRSAPSSDHRRSALLLRGDLWGSVQVRHLLGWLGVAFALAPTPQATLVAVVLIVAGELIERNHFFQIAVAPRMPGELH